MKAIRHVIKITCQNPLYLRIFLLSIVTAMATTAIIYGAMVKRVELTVNGQTVKVATAKRTLAEVLDDEGITVREYDYTSVPLTAKIKDGDRIVVQSAVPVILSDEGQRRIIFTPEPTVGEALQRLGISLHHEDRVHPPLNAAVTPNTMIVIDRVRTVVEETRETIPYEVVENKDATLPQGKTKVIQEGEEGTVVTKRENVYVNGRKIAQRTIARKVEKPKQDKVIAVGAQKPVTVLSASSPDVHTVTKNGMTFGVKKILRNVSLTAYDAGPESTGKSEKHPHYGITYTGTKVQEGRTAAVDPQVIPLGWWFYIEGVGLRRAEDIGSAVKGKKIDLYVDSAEDADRFGLKRGYTVYVIGPEKPGNTK